MKLRFILRKLFAKAGEIGIMPDLKAKCGHTFKGHTELQLPDGEKIVWKVKDGSNYCPVCLNGMTVLCAWCGKPIAIGDTITLYSPVDPEREMPDYAVKYQHEGDNHVAYVGCARSSCAESGMDYCGFWEPGKDGKGKVVRRMSILEMAMANPTKMIIANDIDKPNREVKFFDHD